MPPTDELQLTVDDGIAVVTLNRPEARNALTMAMYDRVQEIACTPPAELGIRALIVTGAGDRAFAAGTDITQFRDFSSGQDALDYEQRIDAVLSDLERCPIPTIAAISGACVGGGAAIAAACDLRIATPALKYGFPIARTLGNCLSTASLARLSALMGAARVREMIFTSRLLGADEALNIGLVSEILSDHAALLARAHELARTVAGHAPLTLQATKEGLRRLAQHDVDDDDLIIRCYTSDDFREGMEAFLAKRAPQWQGR